MSDYLFLVKVNEDISSSVTLTRFVPNCLSSSNQMVDYKVGLYTQEKNRTNWKKLDEIFFENNNLSISSSDYNLAVGQIAVVVPCFLDFELNDNLEVLPKPISRKRDRAPINERASIIFSMNDEVSSYQGEFPYQMSCITKGSMLSFSSLMALQDKRIKTTCVFINIFSQKITKKKKFNLFIADADTKEKVLCKEYFNNSACIIDIEGDENKDYVFYSKDTVGIPIYLSYTESDKNELTVEHTHPPTELFWGENKSKQQAVIKSNWLKILP